MLKPAPLRKVIGKFYWPVITNGLWTTALYEQLECGHIQLKKHTLLPTSTGAIDMGSYSAVRRRCKACEIMNAR